MSNQDVGQAMAMFRYQLEEERDKGLADGARMFIQRFTQQWGVSPVEGVERARLAAVQVQRGLEWGNAACEYIAKLEEELAHKRSAVGYLQDTIDDLKEDLRCGTGCGMCEFGDV